MDSGRSVRKRLADQLDNDGRSAGMDRKRTRHSVEPGIGESSRVNVGQVAEVHNSASEAYTTVVSSGVTAPVVKRGRGRPRKVSCLPIHHTFCCVMEDLTCLIQCLVTAGWVCGPVKHFEPVVS